jgi:hypothetical protein
VATAAFQGFGKPLVAWFDSERLFGVACNRQRHGSQVGNLFVQGVEMRRGEREVGSP